MTFNQIRLVKRILAVLLLCGTAVVGYQLFRGLGSERPSSDVVVDNEEATARGVDITRLDEDGERVFELRAAESEGSNEETQTFRDVEITFAAGSEGEVPLVVTGDLCRYNTVTSTVHLEGNVVVTDSEGLRIESPTLDYGPKPKRVWSDQEIRFSRGGLSGRSGTLVYQVVGNAFELDNGVDMTFTPEEGPPVNVKSESARIRRRDKFVRFMDNVRVTQDTRRLDGDHLQIHFTDDEKGVTRIDADGNVRMVLDVPQGSDSEDAGPFDQPGRKRLSSKRLVVSFRPDGSTLRRMVATGEAKLTMLPEAGRKGRSGLQRDLEGQDLTFQFDREGRLAVLVGRGGVALTLTPEKGSPAAVQRLTARRMRSQFDPETGDVREARSYESVAFNQGDLNGEAELGVYTAAKEVLTLTESPHLWDSRSELTADKVDLFVTTGGLEATGNVKSRMLVSDSSEGIGFLPGDESEPVYFVSEHLQYDQEKDLAIYTGDARGFRGQNRVEAKRIELAQRDGRLGASESVRTTLVQKTSGEESAEPQLTFTSAGEMLYRAEDGLLTYLKDVEMRSGEITLRGDKVDVSVGEDGSSVQQIDAHGNAEILSTSGRARGEKATYVPEREEVHVTGERATLEDGDKLTEGKELTFFLSNDKIFIDGQEERRTKTTYSRSRPL